jgi:hypothetical protein
MPDDRAGNYKIRVSLKDAGEIEVVGPSRPDVEEMFEKIVKRTKLLPFDGKYP